MFLPTEQNVDSLSEDVFLFSTVEENTKGQKALVGIGMEKLDRKEMSQYIFGFSMVLWVKWLRI
jgi:hypothetical protein